MLKVTMVVDHTAANMTKEEYVSRYYLTEECKEMLQSIDVEYTQENE